MTARERNAVLIAGAAHLLLFAALSLGWMQSQTLPAADPSEAIDVIEIAEAPRAPPPTPAPKAAPQESVTPPPADPSPPEPKPVTVPDAVPLPDTKPEKKPDKPPRPAAKPKAETKPLDQSLLQNLIDKALPKARVKPLDTSSLASAIASAAPKAATVDPRAAATLAQAIQAQVAPCWNPPIGGADVKRMTVIIRADFAADGSVIGTPSVVSQTGVTAGNSDYARAFAETARRAVLRCSPLKLPPKLYDLWRSVEINFDPASMT